MTTLDWTQILYSIWWKRIEIMIVLQSKFVNYIIDIIALIIPQQLYQQTVKRWESRQTTCYSNVSVFVYKC